MGPFLKESGVPGNSFLALVCGLKWSGCRRKRWSMFLLPAVPPFTTKLCIVYNVVSLSCEINKDYPFKLCVNYFFIIKQMLNSVSLGFFRCFPFGWEDSIA